MENNNLIDELTARLDRIEKNTLFAGKNVLNFQECLAYTGLSKQKMYNLTRAREIPFSKCCHKLYFDKAKIDAWLLSDYYRTQDEIEAAARSYVYSHPYRR